jgi:hypothetical protein
VSVGAVGGGREESLDEEEALELAFGGAARKRLMGRDELIEGGGFEELGRGGRVAKFEVGAADIKGVTWLITRSMLRSEYLDKY